MGGNATSVGGFSANEYVIHWHAVNVWLDKIVSDPIFTSHLTLMRHLLNGCIYPMVDQVLDRFCLQILPKIHHKIKWFNLELLSMERILLAADYPNLRGLALFNIGREVAKNIYIGKEFNFHILRYI
ncbi:unnamed protein product [Rotaria sp. Silwood2]|nr:unnamed protein product [Rotaria sp. Silwood2]CAF4310883.1 unnamed protein product [Rotaria sp. Silwood2]